MVPERFTGQIKSIHSARVGSETKKNRRGGAHDVDCSRYCLYPPPPINSFRNSLMKRKGPNFFEVLVL
jgi:hypothetical protein